MYSEMPLFQKFDIFAMKWQMILANIAAILAKHPNMGVICHVNIANIRQYVAKIYPNEQCRSNIIFLIDLIKTLKDLRFCYYMVERSIFSDVQTELGLRERRTN